MTTTQRPTPCRDLAWKWVAGIATAALLVPGIGLSACAPAAQDDPVLAIVNGRPITLNEFDFRWSELSEHRRARYEDEGGKRKFLDDLINQKLWMKEAEKRGLRHSPTIRYRTQQFEERLLLDEVMREVVKTTVEVSDEELRAYYAAHGAVLPAPDRIEVSQILSNNLYAAQDIRRMLDAGVAFTTLAKRYSTDKYSRSKGGRLGLYQKGTAPPEVEQIIYRLRPGAIGGPIKTESGFYIVKVTNRKPGDRQAILAARERLKKELYAEKRQTQLGAYLDGLKSSASIRIANASKYVVEDTDLLGGNATP